MFRRLKKMRKHEKESNDAGHSLLVYDRAQKLIAKYESTHDASLLDEMRVIKPQLQEAISSHFSAFANAPKEVALVKAIPAMAYNQLGGLSLYLEEYSEAWDYYEKSRQLALESGNARDIVQSTNNLGSVALQQGDLEVALEQFELAASYCSDLPAKDKWMHGRIKKNIEMIKRKLGR
jgi:tetratricopeptide (TPR) repeat protein